MSRTLTVAMISTLALTTVVVGSLFAQEISLPSNDMPLTVPQIEKLIESFRESLEELSTRIQKSPTSITAYSQRGDAYFFLGRFDDAVADYDTMIELDATQTTSHWRRGIALFYAGRYKDAASQFESYHAFDQVDRENGIWRYLSQHQAYGREKARDGLLKYQKDDREPFPSVYKLFAGTMTGDEILSEIARAKVSKVEREKRLFYAQLYIGLNQAVEGDTDQAREHLAKATQNSWAPAAGYGPAYMWHVGRVHEERLRKKAEK